MNPGILQEATEATEATEVENDSLFPPLPPVRKLTRPHEALCRRILQEETEMTAVKNHSLFPPLPPVQKIAPVLP